MPGTVLSVGDTKKSKKQQSLLSRSSHIMEEMIVTYKQDIDRINWINSLRGKTLRLKRTNKDFLQKAGL